MRREKLNSCGRAGIALLVAIVCWACFGSRSASLAGSGDERSTKVRPAAVAGSFYPSDSGQLGQTIDAVLSRVPAQAVSGQVIALISPHAGYEYSGGVAAYGYAALKGRRFKRVVVIGPSHIEGFSYTSVYDGAAYTTPFGRITVDQGFAKKLAESGDSIRLSGTGHDFDPGNRGEHSVEVELPFLQRVLGDFVLVPIVMGDQSYQASRQLGVALANLLKNDPDTLLVASSDLSHYHDYATASRMDGHLLKAATDGDFLSISNDNQMRVWEACGAEPIVAVMIAAERLGASSPQLLKYANSGDVVGDKSRVVGYGSLVMVRPPAAKAGTEELRTEEFTLSDSEKSELLKLARASVDTAVRNHESYPASVPKSARLNEERGAFVTLKEKGELRGCIGYTSAISPLYRTVAETAAHAALRDPRFAPVRVDELPRLSYEVSVLSPFRHVLDASSVRVGRDGLLIQKGRRTGILLPQVPVEEHWDRTTFLDQACVKAGLPPKAWQDPETDIFAFTAVVFGDEEAGKPQKH